MQAPTVVSSSRGVKLVCEQKYLFAKFVSDCRLPFDLKGVKHLLWKRVLHLKGINIQPERGTGFWETAAVLACSRGTYKGLTTLSQAHIVADR